MGSSKVHIVRGREVQGQKGLGHNVVVNARAVFTKFGSSHHRELQMSRKQFDIVIFEEACLANEALALNLLTTFCCRVLSNADEDFKKVVWLGIGDNKQLHDMDVTKPIVARKAGSQFFDRIWKDDSIMKAGTRMSLTQQHRMNPALASFISNQFYQDKRVTPDEGEFDWKDDIFFRTLRGHMNFPVRNVTVVDTSLEEQAAFETMGAGRSFFNSLEVNVIVALLNAWSSSVDAAAVSQRVTIVTTYGRQRELLRQKLEAINLDVRVTTVDEMQGGENDIIIVSLVRARSTPTDEEESSGSGSIIGFVS